MDMYAKDFGKTKEEMIAWIRKNVPSLDSQLQQKKSYDIKYAKFHWDMYYRFAGPQEKEEDRLSIIKDPRRRAQLIDEIADIKVNVDGLTGKPVVTLMGPNVKDGMPAKYPYQDYIAVRAISTYPLKDKATGVREGDPICDQYHVAQYENGATILALADGCNWGTQPRDAARVAVDTFVNMMKENISQLKTLHQLCIIMMRAFKQAHEEIVGENRDQDTMFDSGTTTMLGAVILPVLDHPNAQVFLCASLGDCKAMHYSTKKGTVQDLTAGNRLNVSNARDPGGRLGPYLDDGGPDLRNFRFYSKICEDDDLIICFTDGVADNLGKIGKFW